MAFDSAASVYKAALQIGGYDKAKVERIADTAALELLVKALPRSQTSAQTSAEATAIAQDSKNPLSFDAFYPGVRNRVSA